MLAPFALAGLVVNVVPHWCMQAAGRAAGEPVSKGTVRLLVGLAAFPLAWLVAAAVFLRYGIAASAAVFVAAPGCGIIAVSALERWVRARRAWRGWQGLRDRRALLAEGMADRERLVGLVRQAAARAAAVPPPASVTCGYPPRPVTT